MSVLILGLPLNYCVNVGQSDSLGFNEPYVKKEGSGGWWQTSLTVLIVCYLTKQNPFIHIMLSVSTKSVLDKWLLSSRPYADAKNRKLEKAWSAIVLALCDLTDMAGRQAREVSSQRSTSVMLEHKGEDTEGHTEGLVSMSKFVIAQGLLEKSSPPCTILVFNLSPWKLNLPHYSSLFLHALYICHLAVISIYLWGNWSS